MHYTRHRALAIAALCAGAAVIATASVPAAAATEETHTFSGDALEVTDLIGAVHVVQGSGQFEVVVRVQGKDAERYAPRIEAKDGATGRLAIRFPDERRFVYPALGAGSKTTFSRNNHEGGWLDALLGSLTGDNVTVSGSGQGVEVWADLEIRVPAGARLHVGLGVGRIAAEDIRADLDLRTRSGDVSATGVAGSLLVDTGSGDVRATDIDGEVNVDTGSGDVTLGRLRGDKVLVDTGSGDVSVADSDSRRLDVDTGSGDVEARAVRTDAALIDTGSGDVTLELDRMGPGHFDVDTGSGRILMRLPGDASARVDASTGSGGIDVDLEQAIEVSRHGHDEISFTVGSGDARVTLSTGSGDIRITR